MPRYLSPEWFDTARAAIDASGREPVSNSAPPVVIQHVVREAPDGDVTYHVCIGQGGARLHTGAAPEATVVFTEDYETAAAIGRGELSAQGALMAGRIRVRGDLSRVAACAAQLDHVDEVLAHLRAETTY